MKVVERLEKIIKSAEATLLFLISFFVLTVTFLQVILRNFFHSGITWGDDISRHLVFWIAMLGASLATSDGRHINVEILTRFLSERWKFLNKLLIESFATVISAFLFYYSIKFVNFEKEVQEGLVSINIPVWVIALAFPAGFGLITLKFLLRLVRTFMRS